jgi:hypothetical protein
MKFQGLGMIVFLAVSASACAPKERPHELQLQIDAPFQQYVSAFEQAASQEQGTALVINDLVVSFGSTPSLNETGVCEWAENETPRITVNERIWNTLDDYDREEVLFHELGHCVLRRVHQDGEMPAYGGAMRVPVSVMNPYRIRGTIYRDNIAHYQDELFSKSNQF